MAMPDINDINLDEQVEVSESASAEQFFTVPLPDDGDHDARLHLGGSGIKTGRQANKASGVKDGPAFLNVHLKVNILKDNGEEGLAVFDNPTSIVMAQSGSSKLHAILDFAGHKAGTMSLGELKSHTETALAQSPAIGVVTQWEASFKVETAEEATKTGTGVGKYFTFLKGQKKFPPVFDADGSETGKYSPEATDLKTGRTATAQARIVRYFRLK